MTDNIFFITILNMCLLVVLAYLLTRFRIVKLLLRSEYLDSMSGGQRLFLQLSVGVALGIFCTISNTVGFMAEGAIPNSRVIGAMSAGMLGGPVAGTVASLMGAVHRYLGEPARISTPGCVTATLLQGVFGSCLWFINKRRTDYRHWVLFLSTAFAEICHMCLIYAMTPDKTGALEIINTIAFPMVLVNPVGMILLFSIIRDAVEQEDEAAASMVAQSFNASEKCIPYLRNNTSLEEEKADIRYILDILMEEHLYAGAAILRDNTFLGRTAFFADFPEVLDPLPRILQQASEVDHAVWRDEESGGILDPLYKKHRIIAAKIKVEPNQNDYLLVLTGKNGYSSHLAVTFADSMAHFFTNRIQMNRLEEQQVLLQRAELQSLQSQINPHFLFNALNTISFFCREKPDKARELLLALSRYFRNTLKEVDAMTTLGQELEHVKSYLMLEEARFEERLQVEIHADSDILSVKVPHLILQPLVENAVKHGAMTQRIGRVQIRIFGEDSFVRVQVLDNGPGVPAEVIEGLATGIRTRGGLGMTNVHRRLTALWGMEAGLRCQLRDGWNCIEMRIPLKSGDQEMGKEMV